MLQSLRISSFKLVSAAVQKSVCEWRERKNSRIDETGDFSRMHAPAERRRMEKQHTSRGHICHIYNSVGTLRGKRLGLAMIEIQISVSGNKLLAQ